MDFQAKLRELGEQIRADLESLGPDCECPSAGDLMYAMFPKRVQELRAQGHPVVKRWCMDLLGCPSDEEIEKILRSDIEKLLRMADD